MASIVSLVDDAMLRIVASFLAPNRSAWERAIPIIFLAMISWLLTIISLLLSLLASVGCFMFVGFVVLVFVWANNNSRQIFAQVCYFFDKFGYEARGALWRTETDVCHCLLIDPVPGTCLMSVWGDGCHVG